MNWYKTSQKEEKTVYIAAVRTDGIVVYIGDTRYFCSSFKPKEYAHLKTLIDKKAWGKAKQVIRNWPCVREEARGNLFNK